MTTMGVVEQDSVRRRTGESCDVAAPPPQQDRKVGVRKIGCLMLLTADHTVIHRIFASQGASQGAQGYTREK